MDLYKLHNIARKNLKLTPNDTLSRKKYSVGYLKELAEKYEMREFLELSYCCHGEDNNCWMEVEGLDYGWLWIDKDPETMPERLFNHALNILKSYRKHLYNRKMYVIESDDYVMIFVYLRDINSNDYVLTFGKKSEITVGLFG